MLQLRIERENTDSPRSLMRLTSCQLKKLSSYGLGARPDHRPSLDVERHLVLIGLLGCRYQGCLIESLKNRLAQDWAKYESPLYKSLESHGPASPTMILTLRVITPMSLPRGSQAITAARTDEIGQVFVEKNFELDLAFPDHLHSSIERPCQQCC